jgi:uncharacterized membrane protein
MKDLWLKFRASNAFLYTLVACLGIWFVARAVFHFDPENSWLNICLSVEASVATCMILDLQFRGMTQDRAVLQQLLESERRIIETVEEIDDVVVPHPSQEKQYD